MSKKHFIALADHLKNEFPFNGTEDMQLQSLADFCEKQNPNFKRSRWIDYIAGKCGSNGGKVVSNV